jgi:hypothetical protein
MVRKLHPGAPELTTMRWTRQIFRGHLGGADQPAGHRLTQSWHGFVSAA